MQTETLSVIKPKPKPKWLRVKLPTGKKYKELRGLVDKYDLHTICTSGSCPNMGECWSEGTATFMILGNVCTRSCGFCGVKCGCGCAPATNTPTHPQAHTPNSHISPPSHTLTPPRVRKSTPPHIHIST